MKVVIIDDEQHCRTVLKNLVENHCKNVIITGEASGVEAGILLIQESNPDIVFLDIQMNDGTGFDLLNRITNINFKIIFTTAFDNYAIRAFKYSAVDYLLKPIDKDELISAYSRAVNDVSNIESAKQLIETYDKNEYDTLVLKTEHNYYNININNIEFIEADSSYCNFNLSNGKKIVISKPLKDYVGLLPESLFVRIHKSYLININHVKTVSKNSLEVEMKSDKIVNVSRRNKKTFIEIIRRNK